MSRSVRILPMVAVATIATMLASPLSAQGESPWIHIEVREAGEGATRVNVNLPLSVVKIAAEMAPEKVIRDGRLHVDGIDNDVDLERIRRMWREIRQAGDNEFVTVHDDDADVRIRVEGDMLLVDVRDNDNGNDEAEPTEETVKIQVPVGVVDALFSGSEGELDVAAAVERLAEQPGEIVRVEDDENTVRVWIDER